jgi:hypothetical protein
MRITTADKSGTRGCQNFKAKNTKKKKKVSCRLFSPSRKICFRLSLHSPSIYTSWLAEPDIGPISHEPAREPSAD